MRKRSLSTNKVEITLLFAAIIIFILLFIQTYHSAVRENGNDFTSFLISSKTMLNGGNPYYTSNKFPYVYPLTFALLLIPLTFLPYWLSVTLWYLLNLFCLITIINFIFKLIVKTKLNVQNQGKIYFFLILSIILFNIIQNNLMNGQVNIVVLALVIMFFKYNLKSREITSALFLSAAISIKLVPIIFLLYLLVRGKYKSIILTIIITLSLFIFPVVVIGLRNFNLIYLYFTKILLNKISVSIHHNSMFFDLYNFLIFMFPALKSVGILKILSALIIILILILTDFKFYAQRNDLNEYNILCLYLLSIILISPVSETHHLIYILPPLFLILTFAFNKFSNNIYKIITYSSILIFFIANFFPGPLYFFSIVIFYFLLVYLNQNLSLNYEKYSLS